MNRVKEILTAEFELLKADVITAYQSSGMAATGNWAKSLEVKATDTTATLFGEGYLHGRKPGTPPPSEAIEQWIVTKGIAARLEKDMSVSSLAFIIARKIARDGWQPKEGNIVELIVTPERIQQIIDKIGPAFLPGLTSDIIQHIKTIAT